MCDTVIGKHTMDQIKTIIVAGVGAVGGEFLSELSKRVNGTQIRIRAIIIDDGKVEGRNLATQQFIHSDLGKSKVSCIAERLSNPNLEIIPIEKRITEETSFELLSSDQLHYTIISGLDTVESRMVVWNFAFKFEVPILHLSLSQLGDGFINWSNGQKFDHWHMSPLTSRPANEDQIKAAEGGELPPCQLIKFRSLIWHVGFYGVQALMQSYGNDALEVYQSKTGKEFKEFHPKTIGYSIVGGEALLDERTVHTS